MRPSLDGRMEFFVPLGGRVEELDLDRARPVLVDLRHPVRLPSHRGDVDRRAVELQDDRRSRAGRERRVRQRCSHRGRCGRWRRSCGRCRRSCGRCRGGLRRRGGHGCDRCGRDDRRRSGRRRQTCGRSNGRCGARDRRRWAGCGCHHCREFDRRSVSRRGIDDSVDGAVSTTTSATTGASDAGVSTGAASIAAWDAWTTTSGVDPMTIVVSVSPPATQTATRTAGCQ